MEVIRYPTWRCDTCESEFKFTPITAVEGNIDRKHPEFCPYCGDECNVGALRSTTFTKVGVFDVLPDAGDDLGLERMSGPIKPIEDAVDRALGKQKEVDEWTMEQEDDLLKMLRRRQNLLNRFMAKDSNFDLDQPEPMPAKDLQARFFDRFGNAVFSTQELRGSVLELRTDRMYVIWFEAQPSAEAMRILRQSLRGQGIAVVVVIGERKPTWYELIKAASLAKESVILEKENGEDGNTISIIDPPRRKIRDEETTLDTAAQKQSETKTNPETGGQGYEKSGEGKKTS